MPQVHNKSLSLNADPSVFNKNSRFMASISFSEASMRRVNVLNSLENRISKVKMKYFERHSNIHARKMERAKNRIIDNLNKRMAYKLVLKNHSIVNAKDYHKALDEKYTYDSMHHEVKSMMQFMKPDIIRERRAKMLVKENRRRYESVLQKNREETDRIFPVKKWEPVDFSKFGKKEAEKKLEREKTKTPPLTNIELRMKKSIAGLRRRIITLDDTKPTSPAKTPVYAKPPISPVKSPSVIFKQPSSNSMMGGKRQGITMSMMKKQKSFLGAQEKSMATLGEHDTQDGTTDFDKNVDKKKDIDGNLLENKDVNNTLESKTDTVKSTAEVVSTQRAPNKNTDDNMLDRGRIPVNGAKLNVKPNIDSSGSPVQKSFLPPIKQQGALTKSESPKPTVDSSKPVQLPVLKMKKGNMTGKPVKVN